MNTSSFESTLSEAREWARRILEAAAAPLARKLASMHVTANQVSLTGVALNGVAGLLIVQDQLAWAGIVYLLAGCMDLMDGTLARATGNAGRFGAFFDSTVDRISEGLVFAAITYRFAMAGEGLFAAVTALALLGSLLVSYVRARAEGLGADCKVGLLTRAERVVFLAAGLLAGFLAAAVLVLALLTAVTVAQRMLHVARQFTPPGAAKPSQSTGVGADD